MLEFLNIDLYKKYQNELENFYEMILKEISFTSFNFFLECSVKSEEKEWVYTPIFNQTIFLGGKIRIAYENNNNILVLKILENSFEVLKTFHDKENFQYEKYAFKKEKNYFKKEKLHTKNNHYLKSITFEEDNSSK